MKGSAVNQDGASNGLTAPNGPSQQRVIRRALAAAGLRTDDVDAVEAHGTGTTLGDPIEAQALLATYGRDRDPEHPLWLGSVKSNIGHAQAAAGVAGVIKMIQALRHETLPATLHVEAPTPQVDWTAGAVELLTEARPWARNGRPRRAGVSAFGISGTNAHVIIEEAPVTGPSTEASAAEQPTGTPGTALLPVVVSSRGPDALADQAGRLARHLADEARTLTPAQAAAALVHQRTLHADRAVVLARTTDEAVAGLTAVSRGERPAGVIAGPAPAVAGQTVFVFPGQGAQWAGMGRELLMTSPVFAAEIDRCAAALAPWVEWSLHGVLTDDDRSWLDRVDVVQPVSFAVMVSLAAVWNSLGVVPDVVLGHSQGEIAAACVAGALSLEDAARVVAVRSRLIAAELAGKGTMASVSLPEAEALARLTDGVEIAAVNGRTSVVVAGPDTAVRALVDSLTAEDIRARLVAVDYASHSAYVDDIHDALLTDLAGVESRTPLVGFYSTAQSRWITGAGELDAAYWFANLRGQVRFAAAVDTLTDADARIFVEVSPHPVLLPALEEVVPDGVVAVGTLRREQPELPALLTAAAHLFVRGVTVDWGTLLPPADTVLDLPAYAFQHRHFWLPEPTVPGDVARLGLAGADHPLLGAVVETPRSGGLLFTSRLGLTSHPWLADHAVTGVVLVPGTALVELAVRAGDHVGTSALEELVIEAPLALPRQGAVRVQVAVDAPDEQGRRAVGVYSAPDDEPGAPATWQVHATGTLAPQPAAPPATALDTETWPPAGSEPIDLDGLYPRLAGSGYEYGPVFQGLRTAWRRGDEIFGEAALAEPQLDEAGRFGIHPALLDAALHTAMLRTGDGGDAVDLGLPFAWNEVALHATRATVLRVRLLPTGTGALTVEAVDENGAPVVTVGSLVSRPVSAERLTASGSAADDALFRVDWTESAVRTESALADPDAWAGERALVTDAAGITALAAEVADGHPAPRWLLLEVASAPAQDVTVAALAAVREFLASTELEDTHLVVLTRNAVGAPAPAPADPDVTAVWGLVRAAQAEATQRITLADLDTPVTDADDASLAPALAVAATGETELAVRSGVVWLPRLVRGSGALVVPGGSSVWRLAGGGS
ncbi:type I polyketide synthase, partial [Streptomyces sp. NPDC059894]|uniref:type I polyketide synthase n=1 Tax=Streptomyces sp. NPDC059894 TaxID=3346991 RepID=UPI00364CFC05